MARGSSSPCSLSFAKSPSAHNSLIFGENNEVHVGHHSVCVSVCSIAWQRSSSHRRREPSSAATTGRIQEEAEKTRADAMGSAVLGRYVPALERLAGRAGFRSAGYGRPLAAAAVPQVLGRAISPKRGRHGNPPSPPRFDSLFCEWLRPISFGARREFMAN
jgi:hypothetical protein